MKLSDLIDSSSLAMSRLTPSEIREAYQIVKGAVKSRNKTFAKHGLGDAVPERLRSGLPSSVGAAPEDLLQDIRSAVAWMRGRGSTYGGYQAITEERRQKMQDALPDMDFSTNEKLADFGKFMNEMRDRYGDQFKDISSTAADLYREALRLNVDPRQFMKNYDFWADHVEDLEKTDPIRQRAGSRALKASDYAQKIERQRQRRGRR